MAALVAAIVVALSGTVVRSPATPLCKAEESCSAPASGVMLTFFRHGIAVKSAETTSTGHYRVVLVPGVYTVRLETKSKLTRLAPTTVRVRRADPHRNFTIDSGIR